MISSLKRTWAEINLDHLTHNLDAIRRRVGENVKLLGVVKADAYGHGAIRIARHLEKIGASYLAVACIDEADELRRHGIHLPILLLGYTPADQTDRLLDDGLTQTVENLEIAKAYSAAAVQCGKTLKIHIKLDTGMGRLGFQCDEAHFAQSLREIRTVLSLPGLEAEGIFTHFCVSDEDAPEDVDFTHRQHALFRKMVDALEDGGFRFALHHCCNAGGIASYPEWAGDMVRCGILLYGTGSLAEQMGLRPVMTLKTVVASVKEYESGAYISYGRTFRVEKHSRIAVLPIGYADGLMRALSGRIEVLTPCGKAPQIGRICMDMCMVDVTSLPQVQVGDEVEIFGEHILCAENAARGGTIPYELLCAVSKRMPRYYYLGGACVDYNLQLL